MKGISERSKRVMPISKTLHHSNHGISKNYFYMTPISEAQCFEVPLKEICPDTFRGWFQMMGSITSNIINVRLFNLCNTDCLICTVGDFYYSIQDIARYAEENDDEEEEYYYGGDEK